MTHCIIATLLLLLIPANYSVSQGTGTVRGTLSEPAKGTAVPDESIVAWSDIGIEYAKTNAKGNFIFLTLLPGQYYFSYAHGGDIYAVCAAQQLEVSAGF